MPYRRDDRHSYGYRPPYYHRRRRRPRRDTAGIALIALFVFMAIVSLGRDVSLPGHEVPQARPAAAPDERVPDAVQALPDAGGEQVPEEEEVVALAEMSESPAEPELTVLRPDDTTEKATLGLPAGCELSACRSAYASFVAAPAGKAFVMSGDGLGFYAAGEESVSVAASQALQRCAEVSQASCRVEVIQGPGEQLDPEG